MGFVGYTLILTGLAADCLAMSNYLPKEKLPLVLGVANGTILLGMLFLKLRRSRAA